MGDPMTQAKPRGRQEQKPVDWAGGSTVPLDVPTRDWSLELNRQVDNPKVPNPKRTRSQREAYSHAGGQL